MRTVIVTGATGNMGQAVAQKFLAEGCRVIGTTVSHTPGENATENFELEAIDLSGENPAHKFIERVIERYKKIDVLVATVGGFATGSIAETSLADVHGQLKLNFDTAYNVARPCFQHMLQQKTGRIFLVASRPGLVAADGKGVVAYGLAKSLIVRLAELMNVEAKGTDVVTSILVPGTIDTPQNRKTMPDKNFDSWVTPDEIANIVSFYCSKPASAIREPLIKLYNNS